MDERANGLRYLRVAVMTCPKITTARHTSGARFVRILFLLASRATLANFGRHMTSPSIACGMKPHHNINVAELLSLPLHSSHTDSVTAEREA